MPAINALYSYTPSDGYGDATTADVLGEMNALYAGPGGMMRSLRNAIPESPNTLSAMNMLRGGLNTAANWVQGRPEIGPDTLAPLGLAGVGALMAPRNALGAMGGGRLGLDMSDAARMARAKEQGYVPMYHGTGPQEFSEFRPSASYEGLGSGVYLSPDRSTAERFAIDRTTGGKGRVMDLYARGNMFDMNVDDPGMVARAREIMPEIGDNADAFLNAIRTGSGGVADRFNTAARAAGYDGIAYQRTDARGVPSRETVVFDPRNIRSTQAAFDPAKLDSANLLAAEAAKTSVPGVVVNSVGERKFDFTNPGGGSRSAKIGDTTIEYGVGKDGSAEVILVRTPKDRRGQGSARNALQAMVDEADAAGLVLRLNADPMDASTSKAKLVKFYQSLGFRRNAGRNRDFTTRAEYIREPKKLEASPSASAPGLAANSQPSGVDSALTDILRKYGLME